MENDNLSFENEFNRGNYCRQLRSYFENNGLDYWWVSASAKTADVFIQPRNYKEHLWEAFPTISKISVQINEQKKPSFGISGYNQFRTQDTKNKFEEKGYNYKLHVNKRGKKGRWWLTKTFDNLESIANEFKNIEYLLFEK